MKKILLTSAGFENKSIEDNFIELFNKPRNEIKALFIPTAAIFPNAKAVLPKCKDDLLNAGILENNITTYDLDRCLSYEELSNYDTVYVCGGDSRYLLDKMYEMNFVELIKCFVCDGGVYVGVSAGSWICVNGFPDNLGFINCTLGVHCQDGTRAGFLDTTNCPYVALTNSQAILIVDDDISVIE